MMLTARVFAPALRAGVAAALAASLGTPASAQERPVPQDTLLVQVGSRVRADFSAATRSLQVLTRAELDALPARTLSDVLEWATGVEILARSPAQSDVSLRGAGFEQVVVLVDGVRMSDPQSGHFDLDLPVSLDQVERVEILRGAASALYGADAMGGVVNVVTRAGDQGARARAEGGAWGTKRLALGGGYAARGGFALHTGGELARSDGHRDGTDYDTKLLHASLGGDAGGGRLSAEAGLGSRDFGARDFYAPYPSFERTRTATSSVRWARGAATVGASYRRHTDDFILVREKPELYHNHHVSSQAGADFLVRRAWDGGVGMAVGGELFQDRLESNKLGDREEVRAAAFVEAGAGQGGRALLTAGLRADWHETFGSFVSPSMSASYRVGEAVRVRGALGRSFRAPTWTERYYTDPVNVGRADLAPEKGWSGEAGVDVHSGRRARLSVTGFLRGTQDLIDWARPASAGSTVPWETRNVLHASFRGIEAELAAPGPLGTALTLGGTALDVASGAADGFRSKYALRPVTQRVTVGISGRLASSLAFDLRAQRAKRAGDDAYRRVDARLAYRSGPTTLYLDATNLLDARYADVTGNRAPGRALFFGVEAGWPARRPTPARSSASGRPQG